MKKREMRRVRSKRHKREAMDRINAAETECRALSSRIYGTQQSENQQKETIKKLGNVRKDANARFSEWVRETFRRHQEEYE